MNSGPMVRRLTTGRALALAGVAVGAFHLACLVEAAAIVVLFFLGSMYALAWVKSARWAFYLGLSIGTLIAAPQLWFFESIFGPAAIGLWAILGVWIGLFLLFSHHAVTRFSKRTVSASLRLAHTGDVACRSPLDRARGVRRVRLQLRRLGGDYHTRYGPL
jgi:hypothetical protein